MARGTQLQDLVYNFRAECRQSTQLSVGTDSLPHVLQLIRRNQAMLYEDPGNDWAFLRMFVPINIQAGDRYYDAPANLNIDRIEDVKIITDGSPLDVDRGIGFVEYAAQNPDLDVRSSPVQKWDLRWTGTKTQIEVWPKPSQTGSQLMFKCLRPLRPLVDMSDVADLDDNLIVLWAAAEELTASKAKDAELKLQLAQKLLNSVRGNAQSGSSTIQMGLGNAAKGYPGRTTVHAQRY